MKAYKVEVLIIDHDDIGREAIHKVLENTRYPNRCISPQVMNIEEREIGEWTDNHPLNFINNIKEEYIQLFSEQISVTKELTDKERFDTFILKLKELMDEYKVVLNKYDTYDGQDYHSDSEYFFESDQLSQDIRSLL